MKINTLLILLTTLVISSCSTSSLRPDVVDRSSAQKTQSVTFGVIEDITKVTGGCTIRTTYTINTRRSKLAWRRHYYSNHVNDIYW